MYIPRAGLSAIYTVECQRECPERKELRGPIFEIEKATHGLCKGTSRVTRRRDAGAMHVANTHTPHLVA